MAFKKLFWGFIFLFDFRIGNIDIVPDFIGYILFYQGLASLENRNQYFGRAKRFALPMIFISILDIYQVSVPINELGSYPLGLLGILFGLFTTIIGILMVYNICLGIATEAQLIQDVDLASKAMHRWKLYLLNHLFILVGMALPGLMGIFFWIILIVSIVSYLLMLGLMNLASNAIA